MENYIEQIENNMNMNGGGLATHITGKFESNRHAIAKIEKYTFGEACKELAKKKNGGLKISASDLLSAYRELFGEPEWHHAGRLPKKYGGGMKKTYFLNEVPTAETVKNWMEKSEKQKKERSNRAETKRKFLQKRAVWFTGVSELPKWSVDHKAMMSGKYGDFEAQYHYNLNVWHCGYKFKTKKSYEKYLEM